VVHVQAHGHESAQVREADEQTQSEVKPKSNPCGGRRHAESRADEVEDRGTRSGTVIHISRWLPAPGTHCSIKSSSLHSWREPRP
jgi:hypothetical protein